MSPKNLMLLGFATFLVSFFALGAGEPGVAWALALGGGMVFGKGYGIHEERSSK